MLLGLIMSYPGIHPKFVQSAYSHTELKIIDRLSKEWYITSSSDQVMMGETSAYRALLMNPTDNYKQMFNLEREIICLFSNYDVFEARTIHAFEKASEAWSSLRVEPVCRVLVSKDNHIVEKIKSILKNDPELPIIVPFSYDELILNRDTHLIENRFREHFFNRDLFAFESPLKKDTYFFGRTEIINEIVSRNKSNENSAVFGLRRSGKTSIVFGLERASHINKQTFVSVDCQSPSVHKRRWNELLSYIIEVAMERYSIKRSKIDLSLYDELNAADCFHKDIKIIYDSLEKRSILIAFDEIERLSPKTGSSEHWKDGSDFILFWQAVRSSFQRHNGIFTFLLIGTNPQAVEVAHINGDDNPLFNSVPLNYISGFTLQQTEEMVTKLGGYMGISFDEGIPAKLQANFGGHPYLIRHVCSIICQNSQKRRPIKVDLSIYQKSERDFVENYANYTEMILDVIAKDFPDEYLMLDALANDDKDLFDTYKDDHSLTNHLVGYGLIARGEQDYYFKIDSVKTHLRNKSRYRKVTTTPSEKLLEVSTRKLLLEPALRKLVLANFITKYGKSAKDKLIPLLGGQAKSRSKELTIKEILAPTSIVTNLSDLIKVISDEWASFEIVFDGLNKKEFDFHMEIIRKARTEESHSGEIQEAAFLQTRLSFDVIEGCLADSGLL